MDHGLQIDSDDESTISGSEEESKDQKGKHSSRSKIDKMFQRKNLTVLSDHYSKLIEQDEEAESEAEQEEFLTLKRVDHDIDDLPKVRLKVLNIFHCNSLYFFRLMELQTPN